MTWSDGKCRCRWANPGNPRYIRYHDEEWGVPVHDDRRLFEMLILEGLPGRAFVGVRAEQAGGFPPGVRRFRLGQSRRLR